MKRDCERFHRRDFLKVGSLGALGGLGLADVLRADEAGMNGSAKNVIMIWLAGGPATIDMWDPKPDAPANIRGEFSAIDTAASGVKLSERMTQISQVMDKCVAIRSMHHSIPAHGPGTVYVNTGNKPTPAIQYPSLGSIAAKMLPSPSDVPSYVVFGNDRSGGTLAGYLGSELNPFQVQGNAQNGQLSVRGISLPREITIEDFSDRVRLLDTFDYRMSVLDKASDVVSGLDGFQQKAIDILRSNRTRKAFALDEETAEIRQRYGRDGFGQSALAARRLVETGVRFVTLGTGGWDTHGNNFGSLRDRLLPPIDRTVSALVEDLDDRGLLESTIVYVAGEFGRTPKVNGRGGRDHWARSMAVLMAGGGLPAGAAYGTTDAEGRAPEDKACTPEDLSATIVKLLGIDPEHRIPTKSGRAIPLFRNGTPIAGLLPA